jgi:hypothetical protein
MWRFSIKVGSDALELYLRAVKMAALGAAGKFGQKLDLRFRHGKVSAINDLAGSIKLTRAESANLTARETRLFP